MSKYTALDDDLHAYLVEHGARQDDVLARVQEETAAMGSLSAMQIAPDQGAFMEILTRSIGAQEALEIGTFTGYSAISIARGLAPAGPPPLPRALRGVRRDGALATSRRPALPTASRSSPARPARRFASCPSASTSTSSSSTPTRPAIPSTSRRRSSGRVPAA